MLRRIVALQEDDAREWIAELECGHRRHVRHDPPWSNRAWVETTQGRASALGEMLECRKCAQGMPTDVTIPRLDDVIWHAMAGTQAAISVGTTTARRYASGYSPIMAFADPAHPDFAAMLPFCAPGEVLYCEGISGTLPPPWRTQMETNLVRMVWQAELPAETDERNIAPFGPQDADAAAALVALTRPGPYGPKTVDMGDYFGWFEHSRLVAMAGERMHAGTLREISGVCTHPDFQGRGLARKLMLKLVRREMLRGETPFLHVLESNTAAHGLYERMGFRDYRISKVQVLTRDAA